MQRKLTITVDEDVYQALHKIIGPRRISRFINNLARPIVIPQAIDEGYRALAADEASELEALEWSEAQRETSESPAGL